MVGGGDQIYLKFWINRPPLERNRWFEPIFARSASAVTPSERSSIKTNRKSTSRFPMSLRWLGIAIPGSRDPGIPESRDPGNFSIPKSRDWAALNPGISGLTKFIHLMIFLVLFKIVLCIYSFFDAFLSPQWRGGRGPSCSSRHAIVLSLGDWAVLKSTSEFRTFACV